jgi:zinc transporter, ZIP family
VTTAGGHTERPGPLARRPEAPRWALGALPLVLILAGLGALLVLGVPGLGERRGPPVEELAIERTVLRPGSIELLVRGAGPDPVTVSQVLVNEQFVDFAADRRTLDRLESGTLRLDHPWIEGQAYEIVLVTSTGATIDHAIDAAVETPAGGGGVLGLMTLLGVYVGVIPVALGMLFLPFLRRLRENWIRVFMAVTVGLLAFLAVDGFIEGLELGGGGAEALGGAPELLLTGAALAYLALTGVDRYLSARRQAARGQGAGAFRLALMVAVGIGLHNLGEGLAIGSAYALGALALGTFLVVGFALHNTTEGLAIVAPLAGARPSLPRLAGLGLIAGAPAILGAWIGVSAPTPGVAAFLLGVGVGAIVQVIQQLVPSLRDRSGRALHPGSVAGIALGVGLLYVTGLLVSV